jgi:hypothetical protein
MKVHIHALRHHESVRRLLLTHGWRLDGAGKSYSARHPAVRDQAAARSRLNDLGLLTSPAVRIEFDPHPVSPARAGPRRGRPARILVERPPRVVAEVHPAGDD